jgi:hypothetical protein
VAFVALAGCLVLAQCSWFSSPAAPEPEPSPTPITPQRTITDANLIKAADLPTSMGGGKMVEDHRNARSLDRLSICQPEPMNALGATAIKSRSFRTHYPSGDRPFPRSSLDDEPDTYTVVLQFADPIAAQRAKSLYDNWVINCATAQEPPAGIRTLRSYLDWTTVPADPAQAEVSEVTYRKDNSTNRYSYFESIGLTVLEDRMMITVHLFYTDESPYSVSLEEEEAGFAHPQLGLVAAAAKRLSR